MNDILEEILTYKREEVEQWKQYIPLKQLYGMMEYGKLEKIEQPSLQLALEKSNTGVIAEFKRKTPLRQWINQGQRPVRFHTSFRGEELLLLVFRQINLALVAMMNMFRRPRLQE